MSTSESIVRWHQTLPPKWQSRASDIVSQEASEAAQTPLPIGWVEPWRLGATEIVGKDTSAASEAQHGTDPKGTHFGWHHTSLKWRSGASEIVSEQGSAAAEKPLPFGWVEPWRLGAADVVGKQASAEGTQKTTRD